MPTNTKRQHTTQHAKKSSSLTSDRTQERSGHIIRVFMLYFVIFGTIIAFVGLIGDDGLPGTGWFLWLLGFVTLVTSLVATIAHARSGEKTAIDELADKW